MNDIRVQARYNGKESTMLKVRTLFSGIGAPESALEKLGVDFEIVDFCEIDKYAVKSYCAVHGVDESKNLGDISTVDTTNLPYADLLVWGFPCQDISVAGKQKGIQEGETRSGLYYEGFRILKETRPKYSIIENVKNLVGKKFKADFESMLDDIESLGYNNYWKVLNAKDYGIPQNRERVFIVSIRKDVDTGDFTFPEGFDNGLRLKDFLEDEVDEKFYVSNDKTEKLIKQLDFKNKDLQGIDLTINQPKFKDYANCIKARYDAGVSNQRTDRTGVCIPCITPDREEKRQNGRRFKEDGEPMFTLTSQDRHGVLTESTRLGGIFDGETKHQAGAVWDKEGLCPTLDTMQGGYRQPSVIVKEATKKGCSPALNTVGGGGLEPKIVQKVGDRGTSNYSIKDISNTIPANPMSDRGQLLIEPAILRPERTEYGKAIRKQYEAGEIEESRHNMTELKPREDGISNTLTTVQKDNMLLEPKIIEDFYSNRDVRVYEDCPTLRSERTGLKVAVKEATIQKIGNYHESNHEASRIVSSEGLAPCVKENHGTVTAVAVREATKLGYAEATAGDSINIQFPNSDTRRGRVGKGVAQTLETSCNQAVIDPYNRTLPKDQEAITTLRTNYSNGNAQIMQNYRIRKLTPRECWRLMGFTDEEFLKAEEVNSNSQLYKQAGNSIVVDVLECIFRNLLK